MSLNKEHPDPWKLITVEELAKHNDLDKGDAWLAVRGIVYDVAAYAEQHPGGAEKIRKYAGKDATDTFNAVHEYVSADYILKGSQVGVLKGHPDAPKRSFFQCCRKDRLKAPAVNFKLEGARGTFVVEFNHPCIADYWSVTVAEKKTLHIYKYIHSKAKAWLAVYHFPEPLVDDRISVNFRNKFKAMEVSVRKPPSAPNWNNPAKALKTGGQFVLSNQEVPGSTKFDAYIVSKENLTPNMIRFGIQILPSGRIGVPLGFHVRLHRNGVSRPYTPICSKLLEPSQVPQTEDVAPTLLYFMIKIYPNGNFTQILDAVEVDEGSKRVTLQVSTPHGYFDADFLQNFDTLLLIAAGSGLAPMMRILQQLWHYNDKQKGKRVSLWHFCQTEVDLISKQELEELQKATTWYTYIPVLTQADKEPSSEWKGLKGRISEDLVCSCASNVGLDQCGLKKACICGPPGFNQTAVNSISDKVELKNIFVFSN